MVVVVVVVGLSSLPPSSPLRRAWENRAGIKSSLFRARYSEPESERFLRPPFEKFTTFWGGGNDQIPKRKTNPFRPINFLIIGARTNPWGSGQKFLHLFSQLEQTALSGFLVRPG